MFDGLCSLNAASEGTRSVELLLQSTFQEAGAEESRRSGGQGQESRRSGGQRQESRRSGGQGQEVWLGGPSE